LETGFSRRGPGGETARPFGPGCPLLQLAFRLLDDSLSGSGMEVDDRVSALEQRLQLQEDELAVLKAALADALRRLRVCEEQGTASRAHDTEHPRDSEKPEEPFTFGILGTASLTGIHF
uniref:Uncharacterized protein n=1 Tax=Vombatus ursinus TaxID=29139 RepID=A0A4X2LVA7_VOMUR